eukprot:scaffold10856_cov229-Amphora_coffeaeformis.AAC.1
MSEGELIQDPSHSTMRSPHRDGAQDRNNVLFAFGWILLGLCMVVFVYMLHWMWQIYKKSNKKDQVHSSSEGEVDHCLEKSNQNQFSVVKEENTNDKEGPHLVASNEPETSDKAQKSLWRSPGQVLSPTTTRIQAFFVRVTSARRGPVVGNLNDNSSTMESGNDKAHMDVEAQTRIPKNITTTGPPSEADVRSLIDRRQTFNKLPVADPVEEKGVDGEPRGQKESTSVLKPHNARKNWRYVLTRMAQSLDLSTMIRQSPNPASDDDEEQSVGSETLSQRMKDERTRVLQATNNKNRFTERQKKEPSGLEKIDLYDNSYQSSERRNTSDDHQGPSPTAHSVSSPETFKESIVLDLHLLDETRPLRLSERTRSPQGSLLSSFEPNDGEAELEESEESPRQGNHSVKWTSIDPKKKSKSSRAQSPTKKRVHESKPRLVSPKTSESPKRSKKTTSSPNSSRPTFLKDSKNTRPEALLAKTSKSSKRKHPRASPDHNVEQAMLQRIPTSRDELPTKSRAVHLSIEMAALQMPTLSSCSKEHQDGTIKRLVVDVQPENTASERIDSSQDSAMLTEHSSIDTEGSKPSATKSLESVINKEEEQIDHIISHADIEKELTKIAPKEDSVPTKHSDGKPSEDVTIQSVVKQDSPLTSPSVEKTTLDESLLSSTDAKQLVKSSSSNVEVPTQPVGPERATEPHTLLSQPSQHIVHLQVSNNIAGLQGSAKLSPGNDKGKNVNMDVAKHEMQSSSQEKKQSNELADTTSPGMMPPVETTVRKKISETNRSDSPLKFEKKNENPDISDGKKKKKGLKKKLVGNKNVAGSGAKMDTMGKENGVKQKKDLSEMISSSTPYVTA